MMPPTIVEYMLLSCPICVRLTDELRSLELKEGIALQTVDVSSMMNNDIMDRYHFFANRVLGGKKEVPVVLLVEKNSWYIPTKRSRVGEEMTFSEKLDESIRALLEDLIKDIKSLRPKPEPFQSHNEMRERMMWRMSM